MVELPEIPSALRALMREVGPQWADNVQGNVRLMVDQFTPILSKAPKDGVQVQRDIAYGTHPRQAFDIFLPLGGQTDRAAVVFVHGGGFVEGHRNRSPEIYSNVLYCLARHDIVGVNVGYRLAPESRYPGATRDVAAVVSWLQENAPLVGVDVSQIFLMGHSAGAAHTGSYAYDQRHQSAVGSPLAGHIVISGRVRIDNSPENPNARSVELYYGRDATIYESVSAVSCITADSIPTFVAWSEFENPLIDVYCAELVHKLGVAKGYTPPSLWLRGHNHTSIIAHLNTAETHLERALVDFIRRPGRAIRES